tara:strand:+ start:444 stop:698 length:255 start_codon:yes stop_codon:yes gene_type:complete
MREPENCSISYCGFDSPRTFEEMQLELLGLKHLIKRAEERISMLEQSSFLANLAITSESENLDDYFFKEEGELDDQGNIGKEEK